MTRDEAIKSMEYSKAQAEIALSKGVSQYWKQEINWTIEAIEMAIEALEANKPRREWIPISEELPGDGEWAIWCSNDGVIEIARFKEDCYNHFYPNETSFGLEDAIAWMPLPEPYKGGEDE